MTVVLFLPIYFDVGRVAVGKIIIYLLTALVACSALVEIAFFVRVLCMERTRKRIKTYKQEEEGEEKKTTDNTTTESKENNFRCSRGSGLRFDFWES